MFNLDNMQKLLIGVLGLVIIAAGILIVTKSNRAQYSETARVGFNVIVGVVIAAIGLGALSFAVFGKRVLEFLGLSS